MFETIAFESYGVILRGRLYIPQEVQQPLPALVMAHGFSATINGMVADRYAEVFYEAGIAVLLYDHYSFGISDGTPRYQINQWIQARGYYDAIDFLVTCPEIDANRIAIWGDSMSGGEVIVVGAIEERVKAVITQVPGCGDEPAPNDQDNALFNAMRATIQNSDLASKSKILGEPMPVVSADQIGTPSMLTPITAYRWFIDYGGKYGTQWENRAQDAVIQLSTQYHPQICARHLKAPTLMMIADEDEMPGANSDIARQVYECIPAPKDLIELDGGHFGLVYYPSKLFDEASQIQRDFLRKYL